MPLELQQFIDRIPESTKDLAAQFGGLFVLAWLAYRGVKGTCQGACWACGLFAQKPVPEEAPLAPGPGSELGEAILRRLDRDGALGEWVEQGSAGEAATAGSVVVYLDEAAGGNRIRVAGKAADHRLTPCDRERILEKARQVRQRDLDRRAEAETRQLLWDAVGPHCPPGGCEPAVLGYEVVSPAPEGECAGAAPAELVFKPAPPRRPNACDRCGGVPCQTPGRCTAEQDAERRFARAVRTEGRKMPAARDCVPGCGCPECRCEGKTRPR